MTSPAKYFHNDLIEISSEYKWILHNLSAYDKQHVSSRKVSCFGSDNWFLRLYLNGSTDANKGKICIYLHSENNFEVRVNCEITLSNIKRILCTKKFCHSFKDKSSWGIEMLEYSTLLEDFKKGTDTLSISWTLLIIKKPRLLINPLNTLKNDFLTLLQNETNSDVVLASSDGIEHKAHKSVLMCRSKVFSAMFRCNMTENQENLVQIKDVDSNTLKDILKYIYTGNVDNIQTNAQKLLIVADKYGLQELERMCLQYLAGSIKNDNILQLMEFAHNYDISSLKEIVKQYFLKNHKEIVLAVGRKSINKLPPNIATNLLYELAAYQVRQVPTSK